MGLDMYLYASKHSDITSKYKIGYWRKFNALHNYIVQNFNGGEDNCEEIYLSEDALKQILNVCKEILEDLKTCPKIQKKVESGWCNGKITYTTIEVFESKKALNLFGSQKIEEWYKKELEYTIELMEKCLKVEKVKFYYRGSW